MAIHRRMITVIEACTLVVALVAGRGWQALNSRPLLPTQGDGRGF